MSDKYLFIFANHEDIKRAETTDIYFVRTLKVLRNDKLDSVNVTAEFTISSVPKPYKWVVFAGLRDVLKLLEGIPIDVYAIPEGTIITPRDINGIRIPALFIQGAYGAFCPYETPILGFLASGTGFATKAARIRKIAGDKAFIVNFGARRTHPAISPFCDFYSYIGGFDAVSSLLGAKFLGMSPVGTMPHALLIIYRFARGDHAEGWKAFDKYVEKNVPRIMLTDTFLDEVEESIRAVETVGPDKIYGVRLDTPGSRKGNFAEIIREVRWKLKQRGYSHVKIFVSGGINEDSITELLEAGAEGFGIGSAIANAPPIDFAMDIVAVKSNGRWLPLSKRGKFDGVKQVWRFTKSDRYHYIVTPFEQKPNITNAEPLLVKFMEKGEIIRDIPSPKELREKVLSQLQNVSVDKLPWE